VTTALLASYRRLTEQAAQPPAARAEQHVLEAKADSDSGTDVDGVAESRRSSTAPTTATATTLALTTGDRGVGDTSRLLSTSSPSTQESDGPHIPASWTRTPYLGRSPSETWRDPCTQEELLLCSETVYGFCFLNKRWGQYLPSSRLILQGHCRTGR
jgi:hypothetical protein